MFNKELLMGSVGQEPHIELTVGKYTVNSSNLDYFGYSIRKPSYGSISRIPLFIEGRDHQFYIDGLQTLHTYNTYLSASNAITYTINVIIGSKSCEFKFSNTILSFSMDFLFSDSDVGTTLPIYFDPPPVGYLDPETLEPI